MKARRIESFWVVGIEARTSNALEMTSEGKIGSMWHRLFDENILDTIPNRSGSAIIAVYSQYESDHSGAYTYLLGARVKSLAALSEGLGTAEILAGVYEPFSGSGTPAAKVVVDLWQTIWAREEAGLRRAYRTDFEVYGEGYGEETSIEINVGVLEE